MIKSKYSMTKCSDVNAIKDDHGRHDDLLHVHCDATASMWDIPFRCLPP